MIGRPALYCTFKSYAHSVIKLQCISLVSSTGYEVILDIRSIFLLNRKQALLIKVRQGLIRSVHFLLDNTVDLTTGMHCSVPYSILFAQYQSLPFPHDQTILHGWHYLVDSGSNGEGVSGIVGCSGEPELGSDDRCGKVRKRRSKEKEYRSVAAAVASSSKEPRGAASRRRAALGTSVLRCCCECGHTADTCCNGSDGGGGADGSPSRWRSPKPKTSRTWKGNNASLRLKREMRVGLRTFRFTFWLLIVLASVISGALFLYNNTTEFWNSTVQTTLDGSVPLSEVFFPSVLVCNINQGLKGRSIRQG